MDSVHGQSRRQPISKSKHKRDPESDLRSGKDVKAVLLPEHLSGHSTLKTPAAHPNTGRHEAGRHFKLQTVVSRRGQSDDSHVTAKLKPTEEPAAGKHKQKKEDGVLSRHANNDSSNSKHAAGDRSTAYAKIDDKAKASKVSESKLHTHRIKEAVHDSKTSAETPTNKRRARSATRPRDIHPDPGKSEPSANEHKSKGESRGHSRRSSIPNIRLSFEDSQTHAETSKGPASEGTHKHRTLALSQARLASDKVTMAFLETESVTRPRETTHKNDKGKHARSHSAVQDTVSQGDEKTLSTKKGKTHTRHLATERAGRDTDLLEGETEHLKSMQQFDLEHRQQSNDRNRKQNSVETEISIEGVALATSPPHTSVSSVRKSSVSFKLLHSLTRSSGTAPNMHPTPTRQRKKFSRGHIDQDPLEVDYEILDDTVTNVEPRKLISILHETNRQASISKSPQPLAEEHLLKQHQEFERKLSAYPEDLHVNKSAQRPSSIPFMQTFPKAKHHLTDLYSQSNEPIRITTSASSVSAAHISPNQLQTPDSLLPPIHTIYSQSSLTSSDAQSEVCLDLPDMSDQVEGDIHLHGTGRDSRDRGVTVGFPNAPYNRILHYTQISLAAVILSAICFFVISFILLWPLLILIIVVVPIVVLIKRLCSWLCCCGTSLCSRCCLCWCHTHLTSSELMWLGQDRTGGSAVVQSLLVLQKGLDTDRIRHLIDSRLLSLENRQGRRIYERFTQK
ncbi:unnamed protein product, partial [Candidula unifasciata]